MTIDPKATEALRPESTPIDVAPHLAATVANGQRHQPVLVGRFENGSAEWHAARAEGIGGSEVAAVLNVSPFESRFSLWHRKQGLIEPTPVSAPMEWGTRLESAVCAKFLDEHPEFVCIDIATYHHPSRPWQIANPDMVLAYADAPTVPVAIVEAKTSRYGDGWGAERTDDIPAYYVPQVQQYLDVMGLIVCFPIVLIGGSDYREYVVIYDAEVATANAKASRAFLDTIAAGVKPPADPSLVTWETMRELNPLIEDESVDITDELAAQFVAAKNSVSAADDAWNLARSLMAEAMGTAKSAKWNGRPLASRQSRNGGLPYIQAARSLPEITGTAPAVGSGVDSPVSPDVAEGQHSEGRAGSSPINKENTHEGSGTTDGGGTASGRVREGVPGESPAAPEVDQAGEAARLVDRRTSGGLAGEPVHQQHDALLSSPERHAWVRSRVVECVNHSAGAKSDIGALWPEGVPTFRHLADNGGTHTDEQLEQIIAVLDEVEKRHQMQFGAGDPDVVAAAPRTIPRGRPDEGKSVDPELIKELRGIINTLDAAARTAIDLWAEQAQEAERSFSLKQKDSERRYAIVSAAITLARWDPTDIACREVLSLVMGEEVQPAVTVGCALGSLTTDEATRLTDTVVRLMADSTITFDSSGTPSLVA